MKNASMPTRSNASANCQSAKTAPKDICPEGRNTHYDDDDDFQLDLPLY